MRIRFLSALLIATLPAVAQVSIPLAPQRPVTDVYFNTTVVDPYRWMEFQGADLTAYMHAEQALTEQALAPFAAQDAQFLAELTKLENSVPAVRGIQPNLDSYYYLETPPGASDARLMTRPAAGGAPRLLLDPSTLAEPGKHAAIDYFEPSPDNRYLAVGVSLGGSENSTLHILDVASAKLLPDAISRAQDAGPSWLDANPAANPAGTPAFYYSRLQELPAGAPASAKYDNQRVYLHKLGTPEAQDTPIFGPDLNRDLRLPVNGHVHILTVPGTPILLASQVSGVVETPAWWVRRTPSSPWLPIVSHGDGAMDIALHNTQIFLKTKFGPSGASGSVSNGRIVSFDLATQTFAEAKTLLPESSLILSAGTGAGLAAAQDALYVYGFRDGLGVLTRIPYISSNPDTAKPAELPLPIQGTLIAAVADPRRPGAILVLAGWTSPRVVYQYSPATQSFADTRLQPPDPADFSQIEAHEVLAPSADGTLIPLSILHKKGLKLDGSNPTLIEAYGAYGYSLSPFFDPTLLPWLNRGGVFALAHVRGGGERGEAWHLAGMKTTKQHTIDDFVAAARYLIQEKYTTPAHLAISGTSAGGIAVGGFLTQHPELIAAVLYRVGITDILRSEQRATGAMNAFEYGSVKIEPEFNAMYAISPYHHVTPGARYPAVLLETGANDPRVTSWMLTKMTARLQSAEATVKDPNPILLRVDFDAGHGMGSGRAQALKLLADEYTFLTWRL